MIWLVMAVGSGFFNAFWSALSQKLTKHISTREFTMVFRLQTSLMLLPFALLEWTWPMSWTWWAFTIGSGIFEGGRIWCLTTGVKKDYYSTFAFYNLAPFFTVLAAPLVLPERQPPTLLLGGCLIAIGAIVFHRLGRWSWLGLMGALFSTIAAIFSKIALNDAPPLFFTFWSFLVGVLVLIPMKHIEPGHMKGKRKFSWKDWKGLMPLAFLSFLASLLFYIALKHAPVSKINPLVKSNLLFGYLFSHYLLKEKKEWKSKALGGGLILAGLILVAVA